MKLTVVMIAMFVPVSRLFVGLWNEIVVGNWCSAAQSAGNRSL